MTEEGKASQRADEELRVRKLIVKLRWIGLDDEADRLAAEIKASDSCLVARLPLRMPPTD